MSDNEGRCRAAGLIKIREWCEAGEGGRRGERCWSRGEAAGIELVWLSHHGHITSTALLQLPKLCAEFVLFAKGYWCGQAEVNHAKVHSPKPAAVSEGQWQELLDPQPGDTGAVVNIDNINCQNM